MNQKRHSSTEKRRENLLYGAASVLFPTAIFCYFCAQNINEFAALWLIFFMLGVLIVFAVLVYCAILLILRRGFLALVFCIVCWTGCYLQPTFANIFSDGMGRPIQHVLPYTFVLILAAAVLAVYLLRRIKRDTRKPVMLFSAFFALILMFNLLPIVRAGFSEGISAQEGELLYQTDFYIDSEKADLPNVYWIHPDGMTNADVIEKYFHRDQSEFLSEFEARGFSINSSAHFEAGATTRFCIPVLMCPYAYDTWLSDYTVTREDARQALESYAFQSELRDVRRHNEMIAAFDEKGYTSNVISPYSIDPYYVPLSDGAYYTVVRGGADGEKICDEAVTEELMLWQNIRSGMAKISGFFSWVLLKLSVMKFPDGVIQPYSAKMSEEQIGQILPGNLSDDGSVSTMIRSLYDILHGRVQNPKLTIIHNSITHQPFIRDENGAITDRKKFNDPMGYYPQHVFGTKTLIYMIDMILEVDPDAVIVIQSDHGLHVNTEEEFKAAFGEDADALELWNSTMSAIRVPEKYQTGEEHYATENPLNLSRYLVNSFVGENYGYLPPN